VPWATWNSQLAPLARWGGLVFALVALPGCPERPSILLVSLDTLRRDHVGAYGDSRGLTPALDALAAEGLVHEAAYTTMPTTGPAHLSLLTGLYPSEHGARRNGEGLRPGLASYTAPSQLRRRGYATAAFVTTKIMHNALLGLRGFAIYDTPRGSLRPGDVAVEAALAWLDVEKRRPIFLWVHLYDAHAPYGNADEKRRSFPVDASAYGWIASDRYADPDERGEMEARYARGVATADAALGRLVTGVRERLETPPLVIVVSDHGESFSEHLGERGFAYDHGESLDEEAIALALVLTGPGVVPGRSSGAVSIRDLYTTILAAAALEDTGASSRDRRDLRLPRADLRVVAVERRRMLSDPREAARSHASAATDGTRLLIVAEDGSPTSGAADADLLATARAHLAPAATAAPIDPKTREALTELGYGE
jgi:arylsulfatase A-like enzyme